MNGNKNKKLQLNMTFIKKIPKKCETEFYVFPL